MAVAGDGDDEVEEGGGAGAAATKFSPTTEEDMMAVVQTLVSFVLMAAVGAARGGEGLLLLQKGLLTQTLGTHWIIYLILYVGFFRNIYVGLHGWMRYVHKALESW
jgi:hypothetical protein